MVGAAAAAITVALVTCYMAGFAAARDYNGSSSLLILIAILMTAYAIWPQDQGPRLP
jgi:hypothetical protein